ncbi:hypothetical protein NL676_025405 [Syzygium grande]|nr:hypothetical protein NL676_025405 [Syzygium grande]
MAPLPPKKLNLRRSLTSKGSPTPQNGSHPDAADASVSIPPSLLAFPASRIFGRGSRPAAAVATFAHAAGPGPHTIEHHRAALEPTVPPEKVEIG